MARRNRQPHSPAATDSRPKAREGCETRSRSLFAEDPHLRAILIHIDFELIELLEKLIEVLGLDLVEIETDPLLAQSLVGPLARLGRNERTQAHAGAEKLHGNADIDLGLAISRVMILRLDENAEIFRAALRRVRFGRARRLARFLFQRRDQALGFVRG